MATYFPGRGTLVEETYLKGVAEGREEGRVAERVHTILFLLEQRGIDAPTDIRARIADCTDLDTLGRWLKRAFTVTTAEGLFTDE